MRQLLKTIVPLMCAFCLFQSAEAQLMDHLPPVQLATGLQFTEGPAWHEDGYLVFSDISGNTIYKWSEEKGLEIFKSDVGYSNGIIATKWNDFIVCRQGERDVVEMDTTGSIHAIATQFNGKRLNSPNDVCMSYRGSVYFTDPDYGVLENDRELPYQGLYCLPYNADDLILLDSTLIKPNGLTFNQDWRTLFVCESSTNTVYAYSLKDEYVLRDKNVFAHLSGNGEIDGITSDVYGNVFVAFGDGGIEVFDVNGQRLGNIAFPPKEKVRNLCFGGTYKNQLFVTAGKSLYKIDVRYHGDFIGTGLLGIPTDKSIVFNAVSDKALTAYLEFGNTEAALFETTATAFFNAEIPTELIIDNLDADTRYFYQLKYKTEDDTTWQKGQKGTFHTARAPSSNFTFAIEADAHLDESSNSQTFRKSLHNTIPYEPDFLIDLGDNFLTEKFPIVNEHYMVQRNLLYRHFWDEVCHSMPLFIVNGNHEGEMAWLSNNTADDVFNTATKVRKIYYPTPQPDHFYTGSETKAPFVGKRENYYAWHWGDALFVVIDPFSYTTERSKDPWRFTLGKTQYDWFRQTLENSNAKYKFVFGHHIVGGDVEGRGGAEVVDYYEMGGKNEDGSYGFDDMRPGWGKPIHQIMVDEGVQVYFHGHDHFYAQQEKDGIIYQLVPQPSFHNYTKVTEAENYGYTSGVILPNSGNLIVEVSPDNARVNYIGAYHEDNPGKGLVNAQVRYSYLVLPHLNAGTIKKNTLKESDLTITNNGKQYLISSKGQAITSASIIDTNGKTIYGIKSGGNRSNTLRLNLPDKVASGIYIITVVTSKQVYSKKIVVTF